MDHIPDIPARDPNIPAGDSNLLDDVEYILYHASRGKRFINYLVDWFSFSILWNIYLAGWFGKFLIALHFPLTTRLEILLVSLVGEIAMFSLVVGGVEAVSGGKTLGKVFTNTRAVTDDGFRVSPKTAFLRCFSRFVPFEAFSALGNPSYPWHDRWTHSMVIDEQLTTLPPAE